MASLHEHKLVAGLAGRMEWLAISIAVLLSFLLLTFRAISEGIAEKGDGIQHYMIARYSWLHPRLLVDHWGKPLFTLLASPFAQLGYAGMVCFNVLAALTTCYFAIRILRNAGSAAQLAFPILMLLSPQYSEVVMNGMTEVLFGMLSIVTVYLLFREKYVIAAIVVSFTPFSRPEYALFLPIVALWLAWCSQWRALPWLATGILIYCLLGWALIGDPLWYWRLDPYHMDNDIYGAGDLFHFVDNARKIFGQPLLILGLLSLAVWPILFWRLKEHRKELILIAAVCIVPVFATITLHSVIWWKGTFGSAGLWRVLATAVPLAVLYTCYVLVRGSQLIFHSAILRNTVGAIVVMGLLGWSSSEFRNEVQVPQLSNEQQEMLDAAGDEVRSRSKAEFRVHCTHPYIAFRSGLDQFDTLQYISQYGYPTPVEHGWNTRPGDMLVWDTHFGPNESHIPLDRLLADDQFELVNVFSSNASYRSLGTPADEVFMFVMHNAVRTVVHDTIWSNAFSAPGLLPRIDSTSCDGQPKGGLCLEAHDFPFEIRNIEVPPSDILFDVINVEMDVNWKGPSTEVPLLVFAQEEFGTSVRHEPLPMQQGKFTINFRLTPQDGKPTIVLFIYNAGLAEITINSLLITRDRWTQQIL